MFNELTILKGKGTIARAWSNTDDYNVALCNWTKIIILAARAKRCTHTKEECIAILAEQGITTTRSTLLQLRFKRRISHTIVKRFIAGQNRDIQLLDPEEIARYYKTMKKGRPRNRNENKS